MNNLFCLSASAPDAVPHTERNNAGASWKPVLSALMLFPLLEATADSLAPANAESRPSDIQFYETNSHVTAFMPSIPFEPEYDRGMKKILLKFQHGRDADLIPWNLESTLSGIPAYTEVVVNWVGAGDKRFRDTNWLAQIAPSRLALGAGRTLVTTMLSNWPQDMGEGQGNRFLLGQKGQERARGFSENGLETVPHPLPLDGGNVSLARNKYGERIVIIGDEEFYDAKDRFPSSQYANPAAAVERAYRQTFSADRLIVLHIEANTHIDQWVAFVGDGLAITEALPELSDSQRRTVLSFQSEFVNADTDFPREYVPVFGKHYMGDTRKLRMGRGDLLTWIEEIPTRVMSREQQKVWFKYQLLHPDLFDLEYTLVRNRVRRRLEGHLKNNGFNIVRLQTTVRRMINDERYVNAMAFRHQETGVPSILFPVYGHPKEFPANLQTRHLRGANRENIERLELLGFTVIPVPSEGFFAGNLHCSMYQF